MAILTSPGLSFPNTTGYPAPASVKKAWQRWKSRPDRFILKGLLPETKYDDECVSYDVLHSPTGRLSDGNMDAQPTAIVAPRKMHTAMLQPRFKDRLQEIRNSDVIRTRKPGTLGDRDPYGMVMRHMEEIAIAIEVEQEIMRWGAFAGTLQPTVYGVNTTTYTYPVQTFDIGAGGTPGSAGSTGRRWSDIANANPIQDVSAAALLLRGKGLDPVLYVNLTNSQNLAQNAQLIRLSGQSVYATQLGPGGAAGTATLTNEQVGSLLKQYTGIKAVVVYDEGWDDSAEAHHTFISDNNAFLIGEPPDGQPLGHFAACPVSQNGGILNPQGGRFLQVYDLTQVIINGPYQMYGGFNGIPVLPFPECIICMTVNG